ncbi:hypothetical protein GCM10022212_18310 [Actimicrobium antarcticum]|uniref:CHAT domain-containing protein n=2 Tax=Actimicrobium antarcticum TaxID=1051899 RepID=A0ABP7T6X0_9BURK
MVGTGVAGSVEEGAVYRQLLLFVRPALVALALNQPGKAIALLEQAVVVIDADSANNWPFRRLVCLPLGFALLAVSRIAEAVTCLRLAARTEERILAEDLPRFAGIVRSLDSGMGLELLTTEYARHVLAAVHVAGRSLKPVDALTGDASIGSADMPTTLGRALLAAGLREELLALCQKTLSAEHSANTLPEIISLEYRYTRLGLMLAHIGLPLQASDLLARFLLLNARRTAIAQQESGLLSGVYAAYSIRRSLVSARLVLGREGHGWPGAAASWFEEIADAKGGGMRYARMIKARMDGSADPAIRSLRDKAFLLEDAMAAQATTQDGINAFLRLAVRQESCFLLAQQLMHADATATQPLWLDHVRASLENDAVIGFFRYQAPVSLAQAAISPARYVRYCVTLSEIQVMDLGEASPIERAVTRFRTAILGRAEVEAAGKVVFAALLHDLPMSVRAAATWRIDPDGMLALLPFDALPEETGQLVLLRHRVRMLSSLGPVSHPAGAGSTAAQGPNATGALILANPRYDQEKPSSPDANVSRSGEVAVHAERRWHPAVAVRPLPETAVEAASVSDALASIGIASTVMQNTDASCAVLRRAVAPQVLHIAAHAVMLDASVSQDEQDTMAAVTGESILDLVIPGRRSALVLSQNGQPDLMLAKDVARLSLSGTTLVVLSACNTGNGDVVAGEGLSGMRRAVEAAGAACSLTSVWAVSSTATVTLMNHFYRELAREPSICLALNRAKNTMHAAGRPAFEWAGFILAGADAMLSAAAV